LAKFKNNGFFTSSLTTNQKPSAYQLYNEENLSSKPSMVRKNSNKKDNTIISPTRYSCIALRVLDDNNIILKQLRTQHLDSEFIIIWQTKVFSSKHNG